MVARFLLQFEQYVKQLLNNIYGGGFWFSTKNIISLYSAWSINVTLDAKNRNVKTPFNILSRWEICIVFYCKIKLVTV